LSICHDEAAIAAEASAFSFTSAEKQIPRALPRARDDKS
jgi:hypothetical protein